MSRKAWTLYNMENEEQKEEYIRMQFLKDTA